MLGISPFYGGTESVVFSMLPFWREEGFVFDFISTYDRPLCHEDEIKKLDGRILHLDLRRRGRLFAYRRSVRTFFKKHEGEYCGIWLNTQEPEHAMLLEQAKKTGIPKRIVLAHYAGFKAEQSLLRAISLRLRRYRINRAATIKIGVSSLAAKYAFRGNEYSIINSGIDCKRFAFNEQRRMAARRSLSIADAAPLYISVGRLTASKNYRFLLQIYCEIGRRNPESRFLIVGKGELEQELRTYAKRLSLDKLQFVTDCDDVSTYLDAADAFVFPSLHEGMGMVLIEAQCSGLPCFASDRVIPQEARILDSFTWLGLEQGPEKWAEEVLTCEIPNVDKRKEAAQKIISAGLTKEEVAQKYLRLLNEE